MEENKDIDQLFNEKLNKQQFEIPDAFLADLNQRLDKTPFPIQKKRRIPIFFGFLILLLTVSTLFYFFYPTATNTKEYLTEKAHTTKRDSASTKVKNSRTKFNSSEEVSTKNQSNLEKDDLNLKSVKPSNVEGQFKTFRNERAIDAELTLKEDLKKKRNKNRSNKSNKTAKSIDPYDVDLPAPNDYFFEQNKKNDEVGNSDKSSQSSSGEKNEVKIKQVDSSSVLQSNNDSLQTSSGKEENSIQENTQQARSAFQNEIQLYFGMNGQSYQNQSTNVAYLQKIESSQSMLYVPSFGASFHFYWNQLVGGTGFAYTQSGEKFQFQEEGTQLVDSTIISGYYLDSVFNQQTQTWEYVNVPIYDTITFTQLVQNEVSLLNRYHWVSVPLYFGYRFQFGEYAITPRVGTQFDFGIASKSSLFPGVDSIGKQLYVPNKLIISYSFQLELRRQFGAWHVFVNPYYRSAISPTISDALLERKYRAWGAQIGVGLKF